MFFNKLFKNFLIVLGFLLIGFGVGMIASKNLQVKETFYWLIIICSLILGGFFTALGLAKKISKETEENKSLEEKVDF